MEKLTNLTPHEIIVRDAETQEIKLSLPSKGMARCESADKQIGEVCNVPLIRKSFGDVYGLPEEKPHHYFIVSRIVAEACPDRKDLLVTGNPVRDRAGKIIGVTAFCRI